MPGGLQAHVRAGSYREFFLWSVQEIRAVPVHTIGMYCPPTATPELQSHLLKEMAAALQTIKAAGHLVIVAGDFNKVLIDRASQLCQKMGLTGVISSDTPTRIPRGAQNGEPAHLDQVFTNMRIRKVDLHDMV